MSTRRTDRVRARRAPRASCSSWTWWAVVVVACTSTSSPRDADVLDGSLDAARDASRAEDAAFDARVDHDHDAAIDDAAVDDAAIGDAAIDDAAVEDAALDASADAAGISDASACVDVRLGAYDVDGAIPETCPPGAGSAEPAPVVSRASACAIRITPDPVIDDRLQIEGELRVEGATLSGTLALNTIPTACTGFVEDEVVVLDCGECDVRLRPR